MFLCLTLVFYNIDTKYKFPKEDDNSRILIAYGDSSRYEDLKNINHVLEVESTRYLNVILAPATEFKKDDMDTIIWVHTYFQDLNYKIKNGRNIENQWEVICPDSFYPYSSSIGNETNKIKPSLFLKGTEIIGKTFKVTSKNEDHLNQEYTFTIVGTYDAKKTTNEVNSCYTSKESMDYLLSKYKGYGTNTYSDGTTYEIRDEFDDVMVRVDKYENVEEVAKAIDEKGFNVQRALYVNENQIDLSISQTVLVFIILILICVNIIYNFILKKRKYNENYNELLKSCGYNKEEIYNIELLENLELVTISIIISLILYFIIYFIMTKFVLMYALYNNLRIDIPYFGLLINIILIYNSAAVCSFSISNKSKK